MKNNVLVILLIGFSIGGYSQTSADKTTDLIELLANTSGSDQQLKSTLNGVVNDTSLYNTFWTNWIDQACRKDSAKWKFLKDLNIQFKTFQTADNASSSLGLTYDFSFNYSKFTKHAAYRSANSFGFVASGDVAFKKKFNPTDFLETKVNYSYSRFVGGTLGIASVELETKLDSINILLAKEKDINGPRALALWEEYGRAMKLSNQYYYAFSPKFALESNQDFSKKQFVPGIAIDLSAKAWNNESTLPYLNVFDYPFALIRYILRTDNKFTLYGATIPTVQIALDYVLPSSDSLRNALVDNLDPYPRIKVEGGFRTTLGSFNKQKIFFNANYRYYQELNAPRVIKNANLDAYSYFVMALQSSSGFYVSYANGKLPFDVKGDEIYSIGFNYKF